MIKWTYLLFIIMIFSACSGEEGISENWWSNDALFLRTGEIVYTWNYEKLEFYTDSSVGGSVQKYKLSDYYTSVRIMGINGSGDRQVLNKGGDLKTASSNHIAVCFGQPSLSGYAYEKFDYGNLSIINISGVITKIFNAQDYLYQFFIEQWYQFDWEYYVVIKFALNEQDLLINLLRTSETNKVRGVVSYNIHDSSTTPNHSYIAPNPISTNFAQIPGYTNHTPVDTDFIEPLDQETIFYNQRWVALRSNENVPIDEYCVLNNFTTPSLVSTTLDRYGYTLSRFNADRRMIRIIKSGQIVDLSIDTWQITTVAATPTNFAIYDISPDHKYLLGVSGDFKGSVELYEINTGNITVLKRHIQVKEGDTYDI